MPHTRGARSGPRFAIRRGISFQQEDPKMTSANQPLEIANASIRHQRARVAVGLPAEMPEAALHLTRSTWAVRSLPITANTPNTARPRVRRTAATSAQKRFDSTSIGHGCLRQTILIRRTAQTGQLLSFQRQRRACACGMPHPHLAGTHDTGRQRRTEHVAPYFCRCATSLGSSPPANPGRPQFSIFETRTKRGRSPGSRGGVGRRKVRR